MSEIENLAEDQERLEFLALVRQNYKLSLMCILPGVERRESRLRAAAKQLGVQGEQFEEFKKLLFHHRVWTQEDGVISANFELLDLGELSVSDYMSNSLSIISRLSQATKPSEFETLSLATNRELIRKFNGQVKLALKNLYLESKASGVKTDTLFSWTHMGVIELEVKNQAKLAKDSDENFE